MRPPKSFPAGIVDRLQELLCAARTPGDLVRIQAVLMRASLDLPPVEIARMTGLSLHTVRSLHSQVLRHGVECLSDRPGRGGRRHAVLVPAKEEGVLRRLEEQSSYGQILVVQAVKDAVEQELGHAVGKSSIYRMLARQGWRKISPRARHPGRDPQAGELFEKNSAKSGRSGGEDRGISRRC